MINPQLSEFSQNEHIIAIQAKKLTKKKKKKNSSTLEALKCFIPLPLPKDQK